MQPLHLGQEHREDIRRLLMTDMETNLYQIDILYRSTPNVEGLEEWKGVYRSGKLIAVSLAVGRLEEGEPSSLCVPFGDIEACRLLGEFEGLHGGTTNLLGPRKESDALYEGLGCPPVQFLIL